MPISVGIVRQLWSQIAQSTTTAERIVMGKAVRCEKCDGTGYVTRFTGEVAMSDNVSMSGSSSRLCRQCAGSGFWFNKDAEPAKDEPEATDAATD